MKATLVITSTDSPAHAERLADLLVSAKLAACVNVIPKMTSVYVWQGDTQKTQECLLLIKSAEHLYSKIEEFLKTHHNYDVPECVSVPIEKIESQFHKWMIESLKE